MLIGRLWDYSKLLAGSSSHFMTGVHTIVVCTFAYYGRWPLTLLMLLWLTFRFDFNDVTKTARGQEQEKLLPSEAQLQLLHFVWTYCSPLPPCSALLWPPPPVPTYPPLPLWPPSSVSSTRLSPACCFRPSALPLRPVDTYLSEVEAIEEVSSVIMSNIILS